MRSDFHLHSSFSADSDAPMRDMVEEGISLGLSAMCFTEHMDYDYIDEGMVFELIFLLITRRLPPSKKSMSTRLNYYSASNSVCSLI